MSRRASCTLSSISTAKAALADLLGITPEKVNDQRLYRALERLLPHKDALEVFLKNRLGELFGLEYDLLLYDVTSTYFEGQAEGNPLAQRGYSRDHRPDCKQVCIGLVVTKCGMPLGYEVFAGNRPDVTTLQEIVETMERRYGPADRIWVGDRGMVSAENIAFLKRSGRRYIVGTPKSMLRQFERELLAEDWHVIRDGLEVKLCASPDGDETFVLCRSRDRREKEKAMHDRFEHRIEEGLRRIEASCPRQRLDPLVVAGHASGRLLGQNSRAAGLFHTEIKTSSDGRAVLDWKKVDAWRDWARAERRMLPAAQQRHRLERRGPVESVHPTDRSGSGLSHPQERPDAASDLAPEGGPGPGPHPGLLSGLRPLEDARSDVSTGRPGPRTTAGLRGNRPGPVGRRGPPDTPRHEIRRRCITQPTDHQAILLTRLRLNLPAIRPMEGV